MRDKRFNALKSYIETGEIRTFSEIFEIVPKSVFVKETGINFVRLSDKINNPEKFTIRELIAYSQLINIDSRQLYDLVISSLAKKGKNKIL